MNPIRVLYIGPDSGTCRARFDALGRIGHEALLVDPFEALPKMRYASSWSFKTGGFGFERLVERYLAARIANTRFDIAYVDSGELIGPGAIRQLRACAPRVVNYNPDNPYSSRDGLRWRQFWKAIPHYDTLFVPRLSNVAEAKARGAKAVGRVWFAADDRLKDPAGQPSDTDKQPYRSHVSFVGSWMPERGPLLLDLIRRNIPLRIFGPRWDRAPEFADLAPHTKTGMLSTLDYEAAVAAADISIALLSKGNRDEHTTRSLEIPMLGSLLCAERTSEHETLYRDNAEAVFWSSAEECAQICRHLLADPARRREIALAGRQRAIINGHFNEPLMHSIIAQTLTSADPNETIS